LLKRKSQASENRGPGQKGSFICHGVTKRGFAFRSETRTRVFKKQGKEKYRKSLGGDDKDECFT